MKPLRKLFQRTVLIPLLLLAAMAWHGESIAAQITSTWTDNTNNEDGFKIERKQGQTGTFAQIATVGVNINSYTDSSLADGTSYCYRVRAFNGTGDSTYSNEACATTTSSSPNNPTGLVAAYGFDEGNGTTVADSSGNNNTGTISGATWTTQGKFGNALSFNGTSSSVTVNDLNSLDLVTGMTLEAWVYPTAPMTDFRALVVKNYVYYLYTSVRGYCGDGMTLGGFSGKHACHAQPLPLNTWTHLALTYDGSTVTLYKSGVQVASAPATGTMSNTSGPLQVGASQYGEHFPGLVDEVRIYNRALTAAEVQTDMSTPIGTQPPFQSFDLAVTKAGRNSGTVISSPTGIDCGTDCIESYPDGTTVILTATAGGGSLFGGWSGGGCSGTVSCVVTLTADTSITATFTLSLPDPPIGLSVHK